jgi:hypothetical protein
MSEVAGNPAARVIQKWLKEDANYWTAIATMFLQRNERDMALTRVSGALQFLLRDGPPNANTLTGRLYMAGVTKLDYDALALEVVLATEAANPSLRKVLAA